MTPVMEDDIIKLLPDSVANQIAAGEVVQRPASVVKELMENSIDAGAKHITLIVKDAGKTLIQVIDNGKGMSATDARMCLERHATSKISKAEDLFEIHTKGFRGEAIASIAAVAQVELKTKRTQDELGTKIEVEASKIISQETISCPDGTTFIIKNLFFNIPARRNFLKTTAIEMRHITDEFIRLALSHEDITFELYNNDLQVFHVPQGKVSQRIVNIFGKNYQQQLAGIDEDIPDMKIWGYIGKPDFAKKTRGEQFFFVNRRYIRSNYLSHAVSSAYQNLLPKDTHPFYVIFIDINPKKIDINVHPTKTEIKFDDERTIYGLLEALVKKALGIHNIAHSLDFKGDVNFSFDKPERNANIGTNFEHNNYSKPNTDNWENIYKPLADIQLDSINQVQPVTISSRMNTTSEEELSLKNSISERGKGVLQILNQYIVAQVKSGMLIINQKAAHERILYEKYLGMLEKRFVSSQQFLFPQQVELSPSDFELVMEIQEEIKALGFVFNHFGHNTIVVNGIPSDAVSGSEKELFEGLIEQFKMNKKNLNIDSKDNLARSLSKRSSLKEGSKLSTEEMNALIDQLFACKTPEYSPDGEKTMSILDNQSLTEILNKR